MTFVIGPLTLKRIGPNAYGIVNTPLIIRRIDPKFTGKDKPTWSVDHGLAEEGAEIVGELDSLAEAKHEARKLIFYGIENEIKDLNNKVQGGR